MGPFQFDLVFIQETFLQPPQGSDTKSAWFISRATYSILESVNSNQRRGIQFRVPSYLIPLLLQSCCKKSSLLEIPATQVQKMIFLGTYTLDGRSPGRIRQWIEIMNSLEAQYTNSVTISLGDLNCRATALGNIETDDSSPSLDAWST
jgi:hypothetical protein